MKRKLWWYEHTNGSFREWKLWPYLGLRLLVVGTLLGIIYALAPSAALAVIRLVGEVMAIVIIIFTLRYIAKMTRWQKRLRRQTLQHRRVYRILRR